MQRKLVGVTAALTVVLLVVAAIAPAIALAAEETEAQAATQLPLKARYIARIVACKFMIVGFLDKMNITDYTNVTLISEKLGVNTTEAEAISVIATVNTTMLKNMTLEQLKQLAEEAKAACRVVAQVAARMAEERRAEIEARIMERIAERISEAAKILGSALSSQNVTSMVEELKEAIREGDLARARAIAANLSAWMRAVHLYMAIERLKRVVEVNVTANNTEALARIHIPGNALETLERLLAHTQKILSRFNATAAEAMHELLVKLRSDIELVKAKVKIIRQVQLRTATLCVNETLTAARELLEKIEETKTNATNVTSTDALRRAEELTKLALKLAEKAREELKKGNVRAALMLCWQARFTLLRAELAYAKATGSVGLTVNVTVPPWTRNVSREVVEEMLGDTYQVLLKLNETVSKLYERAVANNVTDVAEAAKKLGDDVAKLFELYSEAKTALEQGNVSLALRLLARIHAGIARAHATLVMLEVKLAIATKHSGERRPGPPNQTVGEELRKQLEETVKQLRGNLTKLLEEVRKTKQNATPAEKVALKIVEDMIKRALDMLERVERMIKSGNLAAADSMLQAVKELYREILERLSEILGG